MPVRSVWGLTPRQSIESECARRRLARTVDGCASLLDGRYDDRDLIRALGGPGAEKFFDGRSHEDVYWFRVWGARGLLWVWEDTAGPAVIAALTDEAWRVREMAAKVVGRHLLDEALPVLAGMADDPVERVRLAAERATIRLTGA